MSKKKPAPRVPAGRPGKTRYNVPPEKFIQVWQASASAQEAADKLGMPKDIVHARASSYRQAGIKLKKMPRRSKRNLDVDKLNRLVEELGSHEGGRPPSPSARPDLELAGDSPALSPGRTSSTQKGGKAVDERHESKPAEPTVSGEAGVGP